MENPIKIHDLGVPLFLETPTWENHFLTPPEENMSWPWFHYKFPIEQSHVRETKTKDVHFSPNKTMCFFGGSRLGISFEVPAVMMAVQLVRLVVGIWTSNCVISKLFLNDDEEKDRCRWWWWWWWWWSSSLSRVLFIIDFPVVGTKELQNPHWFMKVSQKYELDESWTFGINQLTIQFKSWSTHGPRGPCRLQSGLVKARTCGCRQLGGLTWKHPIFHWTMIVVRQD